MAILISNSSACSICESILKESDDIITWNAFLKPDHKFWKFSDSGMHQNCFDKWEFKLVFEDLYKYQPLVDFEDSQLKEQIKKHGMPEWLKKVKDYRKK